MAAKKPKKEKDPKSGKCAGGCRRTVSDEYFCYGCRHFWCDRCDKVPQFGPHHVEDHREA